MVQLKPILARAIVTILPITTTPMVVLILAQHHHHHHYAHHPPVVVHVLVVIPAVLHLTADPVQLFTGKLIQFDLSIDIDIFYLFLVLVTER